MDVDVPSQTPNTEPVRDTEPKGSGLPGNQNLISSHGTAGDSSMKTATAPENEISKEISVKDTGVQQPLTPIPVTTEARSDSVALLLQPSNPMVVDVSPPSPPMNTPESRPLNVTDALSYLDAVKVQFQDQPDVYNQFLDIMKEFKSQLIDTPGVIQRVSHLFFGHPQLIIGFNTFLPAGYRIECTSDGSTHNRITVTNSDGTVILYQQPPILPSDRHPEPPLPPRTPDPKGLSLDLDKQIMGPAFNYVQKIKQRCDPDTYKQFLDILSRYHKKSDNIDEVSKQIARLFKDDPDLRADFHIFMPESVMMDEGKRKVDGGHLLPQKRKRKVKKLKPTVSQEIPSTFKSERRHALPPPLPDDSRFFDRVKQSIDSRESYNEFLKVVNLFTQGIIDTGRLVKESRTFLAGDGELMRQFKDILGWDEKKERDYHIFEQNQLFGMTRPIVAGFQDRPTRMDMSMKYGSYRKLHPSEAHVTCSGRDDMCRSVLNDEWVSHPTWTSEDPAMVSHKKNVFEEALHRSEEERHEYDFHIEAIVRTIAILEPISNKVAQLSADERATFKLKPNLNGSAKAINHRVIKKIWGREAGLEVIQAMQDYPSQAIPQVLLRLKAKEEEWKRAQREWNKVWREVDARNYIKSLDHQSITFRSIDKKATSVKSFVNQIEAAREEQMAKRASLIDPLFARTRPSHQLEFVVEDLSVIQDGLKLTFSFLDRTQGQIALTDRKRIEQLLRSFVPLFFVLDPVVFNNAFQVVQETADSDVSDASDAEVSSVGSSKGSGKGRKGGTGAAAGDLRKKLLKSEQAKSTIRKTRAQEAASPSLSRVPSPVPAEGSPAEGQQRRVKNTFFTNTHFYVLLRLLEVMYTRLLKFRNISNQLATEGPQNKAPLIVTGLSPQATAFIESMSNPNANASHFYELMLESCERLFDNEVEQPAFEEQMRLMFGVKEAFKIFTIDKLIGSIIKQVQVILADSKSQELLETLKRDRSIPSLTTQDYLNSRHNAEKVLGPDENLFRIDWLPESKKMTMQLIGKDDSSFDDSEVLTGRWQAYIKSYAQTGPTTDVPQTKIRRPFLRKNLPATIPAEANIKTSDGLKIKVCVRTYRLFFVSDSEDYLWKIRQQEDVQKATENLRARNVLRKKWLENSSKPEPVPS
ncbi:histone deacetylase complex, SIN3 component [Desarmillaria tabescens]|uniref:Histone deacetylase complex, SIN3 component n=1 Tax=Armillaria tabescens TaxID=1929756 RepID=A0AA39JX61_ARMTA|nr:histone deacetylase complex, SIN3 component [Desarmillaria tabescens]KAK0450434.1 histone deacetylase complex, SIN3 component [Desarmillaria tabescens]